MVTATTPLLLTNEPIFTNNLIHIIERFFFMIAICIPFDIRDFEIDKSENVQTIAHLLGNDKAKKTALSCIFTSTVLIFIEYGTGIINEKMLIALLISIIVATLLIAATNSKKGEYFYLAGIDGTMLIQGILVIAQSLL